MKLRLSQATLLGLFCISGCSSPDTISSGDSFKPFPETITFPMGCELTLREGTTYASDADDARKAYANYGGKLLHLSTPDPVDFSVAENLIRYEIEGYPNFAIQLRTRTSLGGVIGQIRVLRREGESFEFHGDRTGIIGGCLS